MTSKKIVLYNPAIANTLIVDGNGYGIKIKPHGGTAIVNNFFMKLDKVI